MHEGKKKAIGNSLFLKNNYGTGYQINLVAERNFVSNIEIVLKQSLPGSHFIGDSNQMVIFSECFVLINVIKI
jgi:hypothetical protein